MATGYSFQGQLVRPALVTLQASPTADQPEPSGKHSRADDAASEEMPDGAKPGTESAAAPGQEIPKLALETKDPSPQITAHEPIDSGHEELRH
jgi:hypothetical protein